MTYDFLKDAKFWTGVGDALFALILYFVGKYAGESALADAKVLILALQPVFVMVVVGLFQRDQATIRSGELPKFLK